jgi:hypothetical protein
MVCPLPIHITNAFNEYFLTLVETKYINNNNINNNDNDEDSYDVHTNNNGDSGGTDNSPNRDNNRNTPLSYLLDAFNNSFPNVLLKPTTTQEIEDIIKSLKPKNTYGYDEISTNLLKIRSIYISSPLNHIYNMSLSSGYFPQHLKYSVMKPSFKKGERNCISNYRPISLLTSFSKVLEKVMYNRILRHLNINSILVGDQFGFRKNLSTKKATYELTNVILSALNNKLNVAGICCDLVKAFDCVNHDILLSKLNFYGITGKAKDWIESYLRDRYQRVEIQNKNSNHNSFSNWGVIRGATQKFPKFECRSLTT